MKLFFSVILIAFTIALYGQSDPLDSDTIMYRLNQDSTWDILMAKVYPKVSNENKINFQKQVIKRRLNQFAELERQVVEQKNKLKADSIALEGDLRDKNPNDLFAADLEGLVGVWKLTIKDKTDELTIDSTGAFLTKKSGPGQLNILADGARKISLILGETKLLLTRTNDKLFENEKLAVKLRRKEEEGEKKQR